jgi:cellobiose-specific phosphotransferase system component IIA
MQGAGNPRSEAYASVRRNDEDERNAADGRLSKAEQELIDERW